MAFDFPSGMHGRIAAVFFALLVVSTGSVWANEQVVVAVKDAPPFVMVGEGNKVEGFSVEFIEEIGRRMDPPWAIRFAPQSDLNTQLDSVASGKVDMGIGATTITAERLKRLDFSQPFFRSGLGILVKPAIPGLAMISRVLSGDIVWVAVGMIFYILFFAHIIWWAERHEPEHREH